MKKTILMGIGIFIFVFLITFIAINVSGQPEEKYTKEELINIINENQNIKQHAHNMAESARVLGWEENDELIQELQDKWHDANKEEEKHQKELNRIIEQEEIEKKWAKKKTEYPVATTIWRYMKDLGWNDYICAGILGNIMAETGGQTLNINYTSASKSYYGICQWNKAYSNIWGAGLISQCDYLRDTIKYEFDTFGKVYQKGFNFNSFLDLTDERVAALAFAKVYERCASGSYKIRQSNAVIAYNYFVD